LAQAQLVRNPTEDVLVDMEDKSNFLTQQGVVREGVVDIRKTS